MFLSDRLFALLSPFQTWYMHRWLFVKVLTSCQSDVGCFYIVSHNLLVFNLWFFYFFFFCACCSQIFSQWPPNFEWLEFLRFIQYDVKPTTGTTKSSEKLSCEEGVGVCLIDLGTILETGWKNEFSLTSCLTINFCCCHYEQGIFLKRVRCTYK